MFILLLNLCTNGHSWTIKSYTVTLDVYDVLSKELRAQVFF